MSESLFKVGDKVVIKVGVHKDQEGLIKSGEYNTTWNVWRYEVQIVDPFDGVETVMTFAEEHLVPEESVPRKPKTAPYRAAINRLLDNQEQKGINKYGVTLDQNTTLTDAQRIEHLEEELVDALMYCEHLKAGISGDGLTANEYQRAALRTAQIYKYSKDELLLNGVMGLCGEAGEVIDLVKKWKFQGHELDKEKLNRECGDASWYISLIAYALGYDLSDIFNTNIEKLKERFPDGFDKARSINRKEYKSEGSGSEKVSPDTQG